MNSTNVFNLTDTETIPLINKKKQMINTCVGSNMAQQCIC